MSNNVIYSANTDNGDLLAKFSNNLQHIEGIEGLQEITVGYNANNRAKRCVANFRQYESDNAKQVYILQTIQNKLTIDNLRIVSVGTHEWTTLNEYEIGPKNLIDETKIYIDETYGLSGESTTYGLFSEGNNSLSCFYDNMSNFSLSHYGYSGDVTFYIERLNPNIDFNISTTYINDYTISEVDGTNISALTVNYSDIVDNQNGSFTISDNIDSKELVIYINREVPTYTSLLFLQPKNKYRGFTEIEFDAAPTLMEDTDDVYDLTCELFSSHYSDEISYKLENNKCSKLYMELKNRYHTPPSDDVYYRLEILSSDTVISGQKYNLKVKKNSSVNVSEFTSAVILSEYVDLEQMQSDVKTVLRGINNLTEADQSDYANYTDVNFPKYNAILKIIKNVAKPYDFRGYDTKTYLTIKDGDIPFLNQKYHSYGELNGQNLENIDSVFYKNVYRHEGVSLVSEEIPIDKISGYCESNKFLTNTWVAMNNAKVSSDLEDYVSTNNFNLELKDNGYGEITNRLTLSEEDETAVFAVKPREIDGKFKLDINDVEDYYIREKNTLSDTELLLILFNPYKKFVNNIDEITEDIFDQNFRTILLSPYRYASNGGILYFGIKPFCEWFFNDGYLYISNSREYFVIDIRKAFDIIGTFDVDDLETGESNITIWWHRTSGEDRKTHKETIDKGQIYTFYETVDSSFVKHTVYPCIEYSYPDSETVIKTMVTGETISSGNTLFTNEEDVQKGVDYYYSADNLIDADKDGQISIPELSNVKYLARFRSGDTYYPNGRENQRYITGLLSGMTSLSDLQYFTGLEEIWDNTFCGLCPSLETIYLPKSLKTIGENAFSGCTSLNNIIIPSDNKLSYIDDTAFSGCPGLYGLKYTSDGDEVFHYFKDNSTTIEINEGVSKICGSAFNNNDTDNRVVIIPESVKEIGDYAFYGCMNYNLGTNWRNKVEKIGQKSFTGLYSMTGNVTFESIIETGREAFSECTGLTSVVFGENLEKIGVMMLDKTNGMIQSVEFKGQEVPDVYDSEDKYKETFTLSEIFGDDVVTENFRVYVKNKANCVEKWGLDTADASHIEQIS